MFRSIAIALLLHTVAGACPNGWMSHNGSCFLFSHEQETWAGAYQMCKIMRGQLVEIHSADKNNFLYQQMKTLGHDCWIGLSDVSEEGSWTWMSSLTGAAEYTNWQPGEPSTTSSGVSEDCVVIYQNGHWNDAVCSGLHYYICEKGEKDDAIIG